MKGTNTHYRILREHDADDLMREVESLCAEGWQPIGGVAVTAPVIDESPAPLYAQAMIKLEKGAVP